MSLTEKHASDASLIPTRDAVVSELTTMIAAHPDTAKLRSAVHAAIAEFSDVSMRGTRFHVIDVEEYGEAIIDHVKQELVAKGWIIHVHQHGALLISTHSQYLEHVLRQMNVV